MRRRLALASVAGLAIAAFGLGALVFIGGPANAATPWTVIFVLTLIALIGGVITGVFGIVLPLFGRPATQKTMADAAAAGRDGLARILAVTSTGAQVNGAYAYDADLVVDQTGVPAYRTRDRIRVHRSEGAVVPGAILSVVRLSAERPQVAVLAGPARTPQDALVPQDAEPWE